MMKPHVVDLQDNILDVSSSFYLNAGQKRLRASLHALGLHLGLRLKRPVGVHQFLFTFGLREGRNEGPIQYFGLPFEFDEQEPARNELLRAVPILRSHLLRWYPAELLDAAFADFLSSDCQATWHSAQAELKDTRARVDVFLALFDVRAELVIAQQRTVWRHLLFEAIPPRQTWLALLGSLHVTATTVYVRSDPGGLIATAAGVVSMGRGNLARRFTVSLKTSPPSLIQHWQLTKRPLRDPLPPVLIRYE